MLFLIIAEKPQNSSMRSLSAGFSELCHVNQATLDSWLRRIILGVEEDKGNSGKMADNRLLLQSFATHIVKDSRYCVQIVCVDNDTASIQTSYSSQVHQLVMSLK